MVDNIEQDFNINNKPKYRPPTEYDTSSIFKSLASGAVAGLTAFNLYDNEEERDTTAESLAYSIGHIIGLVGPAFFTGGASLVARGSLKGASILGGKLIASAATKHATSNTVRKAIGTALQKSSGESIGNFALKSVPVYLADKIVYKAAAETGEKTMRFGFNALAKSGSKLGAKVGFSENVMSNIIERGIHMGAVMGIASEPLNNILDSDTYGRRIEAAGSGFVFGSAMGGITGLFSKEGLLTSGKLALGFEPLALKYNPQVADWARKGSRMLALGAFQTWHGRAEDTPAEVDIYNFLLGSVFGIMEKSVVETKSHRILQAYKFGTNSIDAIRLWEDSKTSEGLFKDIEPAVKEDVDSYIESALGKMVETGKIKLSESGLAIGQAIDEVVADINKQYEAGKITKKEWEAMNLAATASSEYDAKINELGELGTKVELLNSDPTIWKTVLDKAVEKVNKESKLVAVEDYLKNIHEKSSKILESSRLAETLREKNLPTSIANPMYELATLLNKRSPAKSIDDTFVELTNSFAEIYEKETTVFIANNNQTVPNKAQIREIKEKTFDAFLAKVNSEYFSTIKPVKTEDLLNPPDKTTSEQPIDDVFKDEYFRYVRQKFLHFLNRSPSTQAYISTDDKNNFQIEHAGSMNAKGGIVATERPEFPLEILTGKPIVKLVTVENNKKHTVNDLSDFNNIAEEKINLAQIMKMADQTKDPNLQSMAVIGGNKANDETLLMPWMIERTDLGNFSKLLDHIIEITGGDRTTSQQYVQEYIDNLTSFLRSYVDPNVKDIVLPKFRKNQSADKIKEFINSSLEQQFTAIKGLKPNSELEYFKDLYASTTLQNITIKELINNNIPISEQLSSGTFIKTAAAQNKRMQLLASGDYPSDSKIYSDIPDLLINPETQESQFKVILLNDINKNGLSSIKGYDDPSYTIRDEKGEISAIKDVRGTDGALVDRDDVFFRNTIDIGSETEVSALKGTLVFKGPNGLLLSKKGDFKSSGIYTNSLHEVGAHKIIFLSSIKQLGNYPTYDSQYDPATGKVTFYKSGTMEIIEKPGTPVDIKSFSNNLGVKEKTKDIDNELHIPLQLGGKLREAEDIQAFEDYFFNESITGDNFTADKITYIRNLHKNISNMTDLTEKAIKEKELSKLISEIDPNKISTQDFVDIYAGSLSTNVQLFDKVMRRILNLDDLEKDTIDPEEGISFEDLLEYHGSAKKFLENSKVPLSKGLLHVNYVKPFVDMKVGKYLTARYVKPLYKHMSKGPMIPFSIEGRMEAIKVLGRDLKVGETLISENALDIKRGTSGRTFRVLLEREKEINQLLKDDSLISDEYETEKKALKDLSQYDTSTFDQELLGQHMAELTNLRQNVDKLFKKSVENEALKSELQDIEEELSIVSIRVPAPHASNVRITKVVGSHGLKSSGNIYTTEDAYYMGGADFDFDTAFTLWDLPKNLKQVYRDNSKYFHNADNTVRQVQELDTKPKDFNEKKYNSFMSQFDPVALHQANRFSVEGQNLVGRITTHAKRLSTLHTSVNELTGNVPVKVMAKFYLDQLINHSTSGKPLNLNEADAKLLREFAEKEGPYSMEDARFIQERLQIKILGVQWSRKFKESDTEFYDGFSDVISKAVDASNGTPILPRTIVEEKLNSTILNSPVLFIMSSKKKIPLPINRKAADVYLKLGTGISLYTNSGYRNLSLFDSVLKGKHGNVRLTPIRRIELAKHATQQLKLEKIFDSDKLGNLQIPQLQYKVLSRMEHLQIEKNAEMHIAGRSMKNFKEKYDEFMLKLETKYKDVHEKILNIIFRYSIRIAGNPISQNIYDTSDGITITDLLRDHSVKDVVENFSIENRAAKKRGKKVTIQNAEVLAQMNIQDLYDVVSHALLLQYGSAALDAGVSPERMKMLALASSEFKDAISMQEKKTSKREYKTSGLRNSDAFEKLLKFRNDELKNINERLYFDSYLLSSIYPHLAKDANGEIQLVSFHDAIHPELNKAKNGTKEVMGKEPAPEEVAKTEEALKKAGIPKNKIKKSGLTPPEKEEAVKGWYRTNANRIALLLDDISPEVISRFQEIFRGFEDITYMKNITDEFLKDIIPLTGKQAKEAFIKDVNNYTTSKEILPEIDEMERFSSEAEDLAESVLVFFKNDIGKAREWTTDRAKTVAEEIKSLQRAKYNTFQSLAADVKSIAESTTDFKLSKEYIDLKNRLVKVLLQRPSLFNEFNSLFGGVTSSLQSRPGEYLSTNLGSSPRYATKLDLIKFLNEVEAHGTKEIVTPLKTKDFFSYPETIDERLRKDDQKIVTFQSGLINTPEGVYESPISYFESSFGSMSRVWSFINRMKSIAEDREETEIAGYFDFLKNLDPEDAKFLSKVAIRMVELKQGELKPEHANTYRGRLIEVMDKYNSDYKNKKYSFKVAEHQYETGEDIVNQLIKNIRNINKHFYEKFIKASEIDEKLLVRDEDGSLNYENSLSSLFKNISNEQDLEVSMDALKHLEHLIKIEKLRVKVKDKDGNTKEVLLSEIKDPAEKQAHIARLQERGFNLNYEGIFFSEAQLESYFPHNSWPKKFMKELNRKAIGNAFDNQVTKAHAEFLKQQMTRNLKLQVSPDMGISHDMFATIEPDYITPEEFYNSGVGHKASPLHFRHIDKSPTEGYLEDFQAYSIYAKQLIQAKYNSIGVLLTHKIAKEFKAAHPDDPNITNWTRFIHLFTRDNIGYPTVFPKEFFEGDKPFISKMNPYWIFTDQAVQEKIKKFSKFFKGAPLVETGILNQEQKDNANKSNVVYRESSSNSLKSKGKGLVEESDIILSFDGDNLHPDRRVILDEINIARALGKQKVFIPLRYNSKISDGEVKAVVDIIEKSGLKKVSLGVSGGDLTRILKRAQLKSQPLERSQGGVDYSMFNFFQRLVPMLKKKGIELTQLTATDIDGIAEAVIKTGIRGKLNPKVIHTPGWIASSKTVGDIRRDKVMKKFTETLEESEKSLQIAHELELEKQARIDASNLHRKIRNFSIFEGKYEMLTLLSHPKYLLGNLMGATYNDTVIAGLSPRWRANYKWLKANVNPKRTGPDDWSKFVHENGGVESMWSEEFAQIESKWGKRATELFKDGLKRQLNYKQFKELFDRANLAEAFTSFGSSFIKSSERLAREKSWLTHYIKVRDLFSAQKLELPENHPWLILMANRGVAASQYLYNNANRMAFMRTPTGTLFSRFQQYTYKSMQLRKRAFRDAKEMGFLEGTEQADRLQRMMIADLFAMSLATLFPMSIFTSTLPPPYDYLKNISHSFFANDDYKTKPGYGMYSVGFPYNLAQPITPTFMRTLLPPLLALGTQNLDHISEYYAWSLLPYGLLSRDAIRTFHNPAMIVENATRVPWHAMTYEAKNRKGDSFSLPLSPKFDKLEKELAILEAEEKKRERAAKAEERKLQREEISKRENIFQDY